MCLGNSRKFVPKSNLTICKQAVTNCAAFRERTEWVCLVSQFFAPGHHSHKSRRHLSPRSRLYLQRACIFYASYFHFTPESKWNCNLYFCILEDKQIESSPTSLFSPMQNIMIVLRLWNFRCFFLLIRQNYLKRCDHLGIFCASPPLIWYLCWLYNDPNYPSV